MDVFPVVSTFPSEKHLIIQGSLAGGNLRPVHVSGDFSGNRFLYAECAHKVNGGKSTCGYYRRIKIYINSQCKYWI